MPFPPGALALIILAAFVHVVPHVAIKGARERTPFIWWMLLVNGIAYAPCLALARVPSPFALLLIVGSGLAEVAYLLTISRAYATGALSVAYPLARGTAPLFLLIFALTVLHERVTAAGVAGLLLIAAGIYLMNLTTSALPSLREPATRWAILAGLCTAAYTTIDKVGVHLLHPFAYLELVMLIALLGYTPLALRHGWAGVRGELAHAPLRVIVAGLTMPLAYALVLWAMRMGAPASYTGAVREVSVVVAAAVGIVAFGERATWPRVLGTLAVLAGILAIVWRG
jgi:drug/metabolite transporter (DMT)-like permease